MRDRDLIRLHWPPQLRSAFDALFAIDDAMAEVVTSATQPALAAIKLAWWREQLEALDSRPPPPEPRLKSVASELLPRGVSGAEIASLEEPWALLLMENDREAFMRGVALRGPRLFELAAALLGVQMNDRLKDAAQSFAAADLARRGIFDLVSTRLRRPKTRVPRQERPLTALVALAHRDMDRGGPPFEGEATPARSWTLLRHRLTGRL